MRYFKKQDDGRHPEWGGHPIYFLEVDASGDAVRQVEVYPNGRVLRYDASHPEDADGCLATMVVDADDGWWAPFAITREEFERAWQGAGAGRMP